MGPGGDPVASSRSNKGTAVILARRRTRFPEWPGGISPHAVTAALGHHDVAFTLRTYAHLLPGMHSEAMNAIGNLIFGSSATENVTSGVT